MAVSVSYATSNGSAIAGQDYTAVAGTLDFPAECDRRRASRSRSCPTPIAPRSFSTVNLTLSQPGGGATLGAISLGDADDHQPELANVPTFVVTNTGDSGPGSLRQAITCCQRRSPTRVSMTSSFDIPASTAANLNVPVSGFRPEHANLDDQLSTARCRRSPTRSAIDGYTAGECRRSVPSIPTRSAPSSDSVNVGRVSRPAEASRSTTSAPIAGSGRQTVSDSLQRHGRAGPERSRVDRRDRQCRRDRQDPVNFGSASIITFQGAYATRHRRRI